MRSIFFDSEIIGHDPEGYPIYDRPNDASDLRKTFKSFIGNGVYANPATEFQVVQGIEMAVNVMPGKTWIEGAFAWEDEIREMIVQSSETQDRIDRVVLRLDLSNSKRNIDLYVIKGTAAVAPIAPTLTRNDTVYEIAIADLFITKNSTSIFQQRITDTRINTELCGIVTGIIDQVDTSTFYDQIQSDLANFKANEEAEFNTWNVEQKADYESWTNEQKVIFNTWTQEQQELFLTWSDEQRQAIMDWFNNLRDILDENAEINIVNFLNSLNARSNLLEAVIFNDITENPFLVLFDDLGGIATEAGIWNSTLQRIEC